jgi:hypothetical protein
MHRPRLRTLVIVAAVALVAVGGTGAGLAVGRGHADAPAAPQATDPTVTVTEGTLTQATSITGQLGYGTPVTVTGHGTGTITWLPSGGATVGRGQQLYRVDDRPVVLFYGDLPLYRTLTDAPATPPGGGGDAGDTGDTGGDAGAPPPSTPPTPPPPPLQGNDVDLVAANLAALGYYDGSTSGTTYGSSLTYAVKKWQESLGEPETGVIDPAEVVVAAGPVRIDGVTGHVGDTAAEDVLTVTSTAKVVTLQSPVDLARSLKVGLQIRVKLPDGSPVLTRVQHLGTATTSDDGSPPSVPVVVRPLHEAALAHQALGPVSARVVTASRKHVVHVPVAALLALSGGGYALERTDHTLVPVTIGMVTEGEVQVTGIAAGTKVVVAG